MVSRWSNTWIGNAQTAMKCETAAERAKERGQSTSEVGALHRFPDNALICYCKGYDRRKDMAAKNSR